MTHRLWLAAVVLVALNLRPGVASAPPLADRITADLGLSATALGVLTTLPVLCMGLFAPIGAFGARRWGAERVLAAAVGVIAVGTALRAGPNVVCLYCGAALIGIGVAVAGALLPPLVRTRFPAHVGPVTGLYTTGLIGGALLGASLTAPLSAGLGVGWPAALGLWAAPALLALLAWLAVAVRGKTSAAPSPPAAAGIVESPWRSRRAWYATAVMGGQSLLFYAALAWLAARYTELGFTLEQAGLLLGLFSALQVVTALSLPLLAHRTGDPRPWIIGSLILTGVSLALVAAVPLTVPWLWASLLGLGMGGQFALALTILGGLGRTAAESASASGMALFVGYLLAALGPVLAGGLRDLTGGYEAPFAVLAALTIPIVFAAVRVGRA